MLPVLAGLVVVVVVVVGLSQAGGKSTKAAPFDLRRALASLRGSPPALAALHRRAADLIPTTTATFDARLRALRGHPVVVNKWASWCGPCRFEFPLFQQVATRFGKRVAFVGLDASDSTTDARDFLRQRPLPYPSFVDPGSKVANAIGAPGVFPITVFFGRDGKQAYIHQGQYHGAADLERDIRRYLQ